MENKQTMGAVYLIEDTISGKSGVVYEPDHYKDPHSIIVPKHFDIPMSNVQTLQKTIICVAENAKFQYYRYMYEHDMLIRDDSFNKNASEAPFRKIFYDVFTKGKLTSPRGQKVLEIENYTYVLPPYCRFTNFEHRKFKLDYVKNEYLWYLRGDKYDVSITQHANMWKGLINDDGSINSNYGQYMFGEQNQYGNVIKQLTEDKDSRRACISILSVEHLLSETSDVPCTYSINFRIRENKLNMTVRMRSQDAIFGMSNDAPAFSFLHEMVYVALKEVYPDLEYGDYTHSADSFHVYERHFDMLEELVGGSNYTNVVCPKMSGSAELDFIRDAHHDVDNIPDEFEFTKWLYEREAGE